MARLAARLRSGSWGLARARAIAAEITAEVTADVTADVVIDDRRMRDLMKALFSDAVEVRKRAADVARRLTELDAEPLVPFADELAGLLDSLPSEESRTRWHIGLVVPRTARTKAQRLRAARSMLLLAEDESNVVRCSAVEGLTLLALTEASLREDAEAMIERFLWEGTKAMKSRARAAKRLLEKADAKNK